MGSTNNSMEVDDTTVTLADAKVWLRARVVKEGAECPCCSQYAKIYKRIFNSGMAYCVINLFKIEKELQPKDGWLLVVELLEKRGINANSVEYSKLKYWGLLEKHPPRENKKSGSSHVGLWRLTPLARAFVDGNATIPSWVKDFDNRVLEMSKEPVAIRQALGKKYNYDEMMAT